MSEPAKLLAEGLRFPEAPTFDADGHLWCAELENGCITRIEVNGALDRYQVGGRPSGLALGCDGEIWFCDSYRNEVRIFSRASGSSWPVVGSADGRNLDGPNDLAFDSCGNLIFSCHNQARTAPTGYIAVLRPSGECSVAGSSLQFPNGIAFGSSGKVLYVAETYKQRVLSGRWDATIGLWQPSEVTIKTAGPGGPDGLALDELGNVYAAVYGAGCIAVANGEDGSQISISSRCPTSCAFDPAGRLGLVFTEAETGTISAVLPGKRGLPLHCAQQAFRGQHASS